MITLDQTINALKAIAEPTRLRLLALLCSGDLSVKDLTWILNQSQPRISRHLKLLNDAGLIERSPEGSWVYYRLSGKTGFASILQDILSHVDLSDAHTSRDREKLATIRQQNAEVAANYFKENAANWDQIRTLHVPEDAVELAMTDMIGKENFGSLLDLGTGTGRVLALFEGQYVRALGIDSSHEMLAVARANLDKGTSTRARVQRGDILDLAGLSEQYSLVCIHQVLHYLDDPKSALMEASRILEADGRMLIVDFSPHDVEHLRDNHAHRRLGFSNQQMSKWLSEAGLAVENSVHLKPDGSTKTPLTVSMWLARFKNNSKSSSQDTTFAPNLETTQ
ncbi:MAG: metalloregulator ArsR/SmtB family transcription factor [Cohaesibacteraceae bacterium]|nr:metalloregulator ArsR/SmtB family transcription factor [Cohaesibacteraceae bacterium]